VFVVETGGPPHLGLKQRSVLLVASYAILQVGLCSILSRESALHTDPSLSGFAL